MIVRQLFTILPTGFVSAPSVHLGAEFEIDIGVLDSDERILKAEPIPTPIGAAVGVAPSPTLTLETE